MKMRVQFVTSECGHKPIRLFVHDRHCAWIGDYGLCWCDPARERRVVRVRFVSEDIPDHPAEVAKIESGD